MENQHRIIEEAAGSYIGKDRTSQAGGHIYATEGQILCPIQITIKNIGVNIRTGLAGKTTPLDVAQDIQYSHPFGVIVNGDGLWNVRKPFSRDSIIQFFKVPDQEQYNREVREYEAKARAEHYHGNGLGTSNKIHPYNIQVAVNNGNGLIINTISRTLTPSLIAQNYYRHLGITEDSSVAKVNGQFWNFHRPLEDFSIIDFVDKESWMKESNQILTRIRKPNENINFADLPESSKFIRIAIICSYVYTGDAWKTTPLDVVRTFSETHLLPAENVIVKVNNEGWSPLRPFERDSILDFEIKKNEQCREEKSLEVTEYEISMVKHAMECQVLLNKRKLEHCSIPNCFNFKYILNHMVLCDDQNQCAVHGCAKAKFILNWMKTCRNEACLNIGRLPGFSQPHQRQIAPTDQTRRLSTSSYANAETLVAEQNISYQAPLPRHEIPNNMSASQVGVPSLQTPMNNYSIPTLNLGFLDQVLLPLNEGTNRHLTTVDNMPNMAATLSDMSSKTFNTNEAYQESASSGFISHQAGSFGVQNQTSVTSSGIHSLVSSGSEGSNQALNIVPYAPPRQIPMDELNVPTLNLDFLDQVSFLSGEGSNRILTTMDSMLNRASTLGRMQSQSETLNTGEAAYQESTSSSFIPHQAGSFGVHNQASMTSSDIRSLVSSGSEGSNQALNIVPYAPPRQIPMDELNVPTSNLDFLDQVSFLSGEGSNRILTTMDSMLNRASTVGGMQSQSETLNADEAKSYQESASSGFIPHQARSFGVHNQASMTSSEIHSLVSSGSEGTIKL